MEIGQKSKVLNWISTKKSNLKPLKNVNFRKIHFKKSVGIVQTQHFSFLPIKECFVYATKYLTWDIHKYKITPPPPKHPWCGFFHVRFSPCITIPILNNQTFRR